MPRVRSLSAARVFCTRTTNKPLTCKPHHDHRHLIDAHQLVGELLQPGQRLLVAKGGKGGAGVRAPSREAKQRDLEREMRRARDAGAEVVAVMDSNWQADARGLPGQQLSLQLLLRVVADVGIVGFPNAGEDEGVCMWCCGGFACLRALPHLPALVAPFHSLYKPPSSLPTPCSQPRQASPRCSRRSRAPRPRLRPTPSPR